MQVLTHDYRRDQIVARLQDQYGRGQADHVLTVIRHKGHPRELLGDIGFSAARKIKTVWGKGYLFSRSEWEC